MYDAIATGLAEASPTSIASSSKGMANDMSWPSGPATMAASSTTTEASFVPSTASARPRFTTRLIGLPHEEGQALLGELCDFVERPEHVRRHTWGAGDIMLWDSRALIHHASPIAPGAQSCSYRLSLYDELPPYVEQRPGVQAPSSKLRKTGS